MFRLTPAQLKLIIYSTLLLFILAIILTVRALGEGRPDYYVNCTDAEAHHDTNIPSTSKYYRQALDKNHNGIACET